MFLGVPAAWPPPAVLDGKVKFGYTLSLMDGFTGYLNTPVHRAPSRV